MENTINETKDETVQNETTQAEELNVDTTVPEVTDTAPVEDQKPLTKEEQLNLLINQRMGNFDIHITYSDLKYVKNSLNDKVEWKGPSEAYLLLIANLSITNTLQSLDQKVQEPVKVPFSSAVLESVNYFFSKITGKGVDSAQKIFGVSMILRPAIENIKKLDNLINSLKEELNTEKAKQSTDK